ncbi:class F sortase [Streptomyces sp. 71268]|uniref:class F sortase n=1 Tax=Streptomyces sp. 71268 TaxID=3002640 RepID=UPI0023F9FD6F|nr:class F sortase [Streptomyces sp. 71268]WEV27620.1 class F sortase [Streptomyces sp. 71268]
MVEAPTPGAGRGRLLVGLAWAAVVVALWLWGKGGGAGIGAAPTTGDVAAAGRPGGRVLPPPHPPLPAAAPRALDAPAAEVRRARVVGRGLDAAGAVEPPPYDRPGDVGWYRAGPRPGEAGAAVLVGHVDTAYRPAVFHRLSALEPRDRVRVARADGAVAEFTVEDVAVVTRDRFDAHRVYGPRRVGRAELRLITCGGTFDRATRTYSANVVVSAYLTAVRHPG